MSVTNIGPSFWPPGLTNQPQPSQGISPPPPRVYECSKGHQAVSGAMHGSDFDVVNAANQGWCMACFIDEMRARFPIVQLHPCLECGAVEGYNHAVDCLLAKVREVKP